MADKYPRIVGQKNDGRVVEVDEGEYVLEAAAHRDAMGLYSCWHSVDPCRAGGYLLCWLGETLHTADLLSLASSDRYIADLAAKRPAPVQSTEIVAAKS